MRFIMISDYVTLVLRGAVSPAHDTESHSRRRPHRLPDDILLTPTLVINYYSCFALHFVAELRSFYDGQMLSFTTPQLES